MIDIQQLEYIIESRRVLDQTFSLPFAIQTKFKKLVFSWFSFEISRENGEDWVSIIDYIYILDYNEHIKKYDVSITAPAYFDATPPALYDEYLPELNKICADYSEKEMDNLFVSMGYKPLYESYLIVKDFVKRRFE